MSGLKEELQRTKQSLINKEKTMAQDAKKRDVEMERLRDQLKLAVRDNVMAKAEIKPLAKQPERKHDIQLDVNDALLHENSVLRELLMEQCTQLKQLYEEYELPESEAILAQPLEWNQKEISSGFQKLVLGLMDFVEDVREKDRQFKLLEDALLKTENKRARLE